MTSANRRYLSSLNISGKRGENQRYSGIAFPFSGTVLSTYAPKLDENVIRSSIEMILMTPPGQRVMRPDFGSRIQFYIFDPSDILLAIAVRAATAEAISEFEPRVRLGPVEVTVKDDVIYVDIAMAIPRSYGYEDINVQVPLDREKLFR